MTAGVTPTIEHLISAVHRRVLDHARRFRFIYTLLAIGLFVVGMLVSIMTVDLEWQRVQPVWFVMNFLVGSPIAIALNATGLKLSAEIVGSSLGYRTALRTCCVALCSNLLPVPAGTLVQTSSLVSSGGEAIRSGMIVVIGNLLSLSLVVTILGAVLSLMGTMAGPPCFVAGSILLTGSTIYVLRKSTLYVASIFLGIRVMRAVIMIVRIQLSFLVIGVVVSPVEAAAFTAAMTVGTTAAVFPAGLGISESLAAFIAVATTVPPGAAFLATGLNRITTLAFAAIVLFLPFGRERDA